MLSQQHTTSPVNKRRNDNAVTAPSNMLRLQMSPGSASDRSGGGSDTESNASPCGAFFANPTINDPTKSQHSTKQSRTSRNQRVHSSMDTAALKAAKDGARNRLPSIGEMVDSCQHLDSTFAMKEY